MEVMSEQHAPFKTLGTHLRYLREQSKESLAEVSGAVEIEEGRLIRMEDGLERPAEDILLLLISHFEMPDQEAVQLWELAGYDGAPERVHLNSEETPAASAQKAVVMFLALDMRAIYSDGMQATTNTSGVTLNFTQTGGHAQPHSIGRIGMSYQQAHQVVRDLQQALIKAKYLDGPKRLPPSTDESID